MSGKLTIEFTLPGTNGPAYSISLGTVTRLTNSIQKRVQIYPIVPLDMQSAFPIEDSNSQTYSIEFTHVNGQDGMTNAEWYNILTTSIDRWQARTDGCVLTYIPDTPYMGDILDHVGGYIGSISRTYVAGMNEMITGSLEFTVGSMYINNTVRTRAGLTTSGIGSEQNYEDMSILLSDSSNRVWYAIMNGGGKDEYNLIDSLTITAGAESPFEKAVITIPKKKLFETIPNLKGDLMDGMNNLVINCMGEHSMYLDKAKQSGNKVTLTAITHAQKYQQISIDGDIEGAPLELIRTILSNGTYGVSYNIESNFITNCVENSTIGRIKVPSGSKIWRVLQICATILGGRIFFADNKVYLLKYFKEDDSDPTTQPIGISAPGNVHTKWDEVVDLHGSNFFRARVVSDTEVDPEGFAPVKNFANVRSMDSMSEGRNVFDALSVDAYGVLSKGTLQLSELSGSQAEVFTRNHLRYLREPQKAITFTLKEGYGESGMPTKIWRSYFGPSAQVGKIVDREGEEVLTNISYLYPGMNKAAYNKLILSSYTRRFPQLTCEYTFGTVANISLAENTSQVSNTLNTI